ncbi:MAG: DUF3160 domain-containing protein, partial [Myxococcota bacterium]
EKALRAVHYALPELVKATPALAESAQDLDLYLSVALNLLDAEPDHGRLLTAPRIIDEAAVQAVLAKVASLQLENPGMGTGGTTLYGDDRAVDWSQFKPRGHYTKNERLQRYFRAMMWLGRADTGFLLEKPRQLRAAALLSSLMASTGAGKDMQVLRDVVDLMVGHSDDLGPIDLAKVMTDEKLMSPAALVPAAAIAHLADALAASGLGQQRIRSQLVVSPPEQPGKVAPPPTFQLFGQRFILDSFILSKVVYDDILYKGVKQERRMPTGLDVMAALGGEYALRLLAAPGGELDQWKYAANLAAVSDVVIAWSADHWHDSLYNLWLDALRSLNAPPTGKQVPEAMKRDAWAAKMLQTQLASWAELRHDTILYAKQSYTASVGCLYPRGFVEPYPTFFQKLQTFASEAARRLDALVGPSLPKERVQRYSGFFQNFASVMGRLRVMAEKELRGEVFDGKEEAFLKDTIERHVVDDGYMPTPDWTGWYVGLVFTPAGEDVITAAIQWKPTIADVHTDPDAGKVLEVGTGNADFTVLAVDNAGDKAIHVGPTFSYYEFQQPAADRLTDEAWTGVVARLAPPGRRRGSCPGSCADAAAAVAGRGMRARRQ